MTNKVEVQQLAPNPATNHSMSNSPAQEDSPSSEVATFDLKLGQTDEPLAVLPFLSVQHSFLELALAQQPMYSFPPGVPAMLLVSRASDFYLKKPLLNREQSGGKNELVTDSLYKGSTISGIKVRKIMCVTGGDNHVIHPLSPSAVSR
jgi:hypothetical protein